MIFARFLLNFFLGFVQNYFCVGGVILGYLGQLWIARTELWIVKTRHTWLRIAKKRHETQFRREYSFESKTEWFSSFIALHLLLEWSVRSHHRRASIVKLEKILDHDQSKKISKFLPTSKKCENIYFCLIQMNSQNSSYLKVRRNCVIALWRHHPNKGRLGVSAIVKLSLIKTENV